MVEKSLFDEIGGFDEALQINEDWDLVIRMAQKARFSLVPKPLVVIYRTANSVCWDLNGGTAARERMLTEYAALYAGHPAPRARQNYIIGGQNLQSRAYGDAVRRFRQSFRDVPSVRCFLQIQRARLRALSKIYRN